MSLRTSELWLTCILRWLDQRDSGTLSLDSLNALFRECFPHEPPVAFFVALKKEINHLSPCYHPGDIPCERLYSDAEVEWCEDGCDMPVGQGSHVRVSLTAGEEDRIFLYVCGKSVGRHLEPVIRLLAWIVRMLLIHRREKSLLEGYSRLINRLPVGFYRSTPDGRITDFNPTLMKILGYQDPEELKKINVQDLYYEPEQREQWKNQLSRQTSVINYEIKLHRPDGEEIWVNDSATLVELADGSVFFEGIIQDITERKILETEWLNHIQHLEKYRKLMTHLFTAPHVIDRSIRDGVVYISEKVKNIVEFDGIAFWALTPDGKEWRLLNAFDFSTGDHSYGLRIEKHENFLDWLSSHRCVECRARDNWEPLPDELCQYLDEKGIETVLIAPGQMGQEVLGFVLFESKRPDWRWNPDDYILAGDLADLMRQLILNERIREQARVLMAMNRVITQGQFVQSVDALIELYLKELQAITGVPIAYLRIFDNEVAIGCQPETMVKLFFVLNESGLTYERPVILDAESIKTAVKQDIMDIQSLVLLPLKVNHQLDAFAILADTEERIWNEEFLQAAMNMAHQVILLYNRLIHLQTEQKRSQLMHQLQQLSSGLNTPRTLDDMLAYIGRCVLQLLKADRVLVLGRDGEKRLRIKWPPDLEMDLRHQIMQMLDWIQSTFSQTDKDTFLITDLAQISPGSPLYHILEAGYRSLAGWPVPYGEDGWAFVMALFRRPRTLDIVELEAADTFFRQACSALTISELLERIQHLGQRDPLTRLYNRTYFEETLNHAVATARLQNMQHALMIIDLDHFATINDTFGHRVADQLLCEVADVLMRAARPGEVVARLIGDSFAVLAYGLSEESALDRANEFQKAINHHHYSVDLGPFRISCSIGVSIIQVNTHDAMEVMAQADAACATAKILGRNRIRLFQPEDIHRSKMIADDIRISELVRHALQSNLLTVYFQPIYNLIDETIHAYEVLLRLKDGSRIINAYDFIPVAERYAQMPELDLWVVEKTLKTLKHHHRQRRPFRLTVNLSGPTLERKDVLKEIEGLIRYHAPEPGSLVIEVTENTALAQLMGATDWIQNVHKAFGIPFALDDFGIGFSSFGHLKHLPIEYLKIDMNFVQSISRSEIDRVLVQSILQVCRSLNYKAVAEGIENGQIFSVIRDLKVPYGQGFYLGPPMPEPAKVENGQEGSSNSNQDD